MHATLSSHEWKVIVWTQVCQMWIKFFTQDGSFTQCRMYLLNPMSSLMYFLISLCANVQNTQIILCPRKHHNCEISKIPHGKCPSAPAYLENPSAYASFFFFFSLLHVDLRCPHMTQKSMQFRETREVSTGWRPGCPWQLEPAPPTATPSPPREGPSNTRSLFVETHSPALHPALLSFLPQLHPRWKSRSPQICCTRRGNGALVPAKPRLSHSISGCQSPFLIDWHCENQERNETNWFILGVGRLAFYLKVIK